VIELKDYPLLFNHCCRRKLFLSTIKCSTIFQIHKYIQDGYGWT